MIRCRGASAPILAAFLAFLAPSLPLTADAISFGADSVSSILATGKERTTLTGHAVVTSDKIHITADRIEISGKDYGILVCSGNVVADDKENGIHLTAPRLTYDRATSMALLQGSSVLVDSENRVVLKAEWIQDDGKNGVTLAQVNVRILKEGLACRSEYVVYRRESHLLELSGAPRVIKDGDEYRASRMTVNTDTEEISLEGKVSGSIKTKEKQDEAAAPSTPPAAPSTDPASGAAPSATALPGGATLPAGAAPPPAGATPPAPPSTGGTP